MLQNRLWYTMLRTSRNQRIKKMKNLLTTLLEKLSENSTWRGLILIAIAVGVKIEPELQESIIVAGLGIIGLINVVRKG